MKIEFNDLFNLVENKVSLFEQNFLQKIGTALAKPVGLAAKGAEIASMPGRFIKGAHRALVTKGGDTQGGIAAGLRDLEGALDPSKKRREEEAKNKEEDKRRRQIQTPGQSAETEDFDKDVVQGLVSSAAQRNSAAAATASTGKQGTAVTAVTPGNTQSGTVQGGGQVTQGQVISGGLPGTAPAGTSTAASTASTQITPQAMQKIKLKTGDIFTLPTKYGRVQRYKINKIDDKNNIVNATRITSTM